MEADFTCNTSTKTIAVIQDEISRENRAQIDNRLAWLEAYCAVLPMTVSIAMELHSISARIEVLRQHDPTLNTSDHG